MEDTASDEGAEDNEGAEVEIEEQGGSMEEAKFPGEGEFDDVDDKEEPGAGADEVLFGEGEGKEVDGHDGAGGVCEHGDDAGPDAHGPREGAGVRDGGAELRESALEALDKYG